MFTQPLSIPFPTHASILRRIQTLEANIIEAERIARVRREDAAWRKAAEARRSAHQKQEADLLAKRKADREAEAESLLRNRPLLVLLLQEGREALVQHLQSEAPGESDDPESSSVESRAGALVDTLVRAEHDIFIGGPYNFPTGPDAYQPSYGYREPPGGRDAWFALLSYLKPIVEARNAGKKPARATLTNKETPNVSSHSAAAPPDPTDQQPEPPDESLTPYQLNERRRAQLQAEIMRARLARFRDDTPDPPEPTGRPHPHWSRWPRIDWSRYYP